MHDDVTLIQSYRAGDTNALRELVERYTDPIYNFTYKLGARDEAEDITQEVFIKVWKKIDSFDEEKSSFKTWLFTIARNTTIDYLRKRRPILFTTLDTEDALPFEESITDTEPLPDIQFDATLNSEKIHRHLLELPEQYRSVINLHYTEEMTFDEIGKVLGKPLNTVKSWHRRALIKLKELLG